MPNTHGFGWERKDHEFACAAPFWAILVFWLGRIVVLAATTEFVFSIRETMIFTAAVGLFVLVFQTQSSTITLLVAMLGYSTVYLFLRWFYQSIYHYYRKARLHVLANRSAAHSDDTLPISFPEITSSSTVVRQAYETAYRRCMAMQFANIKETMKYFPAWYALVMATLAGFLTFSEVFFHDDPNPLDGYRAGYACLQVHGLATQIGLVDSVLGFQLEWGDGIFPFWGIVYANYHFLRTWSFLGCEPNQLGFGIFAGRDEFSIAMPMLATLLIWVNVFAYRVMISGLQLTIGQTMLFTAFVGSLIVIFQSPSNMTMATAAILGFSTVLLFAMWMIRLVINLVGKASLRAT